MNKIILYSVIGLLSSFTWAQLDANNMMGLPSGTTTDITSVTPNIGSIVYSETDDNVYKFTSNGWQIINTNTYIGHFLISSTGAINITGLPFQPSQVKFTAYANVEVENLDDDNETGNNNNNGIPNAFGYMTGYARQNLNNTITQQVIYGGASGNSINDISRYASSSNCIGLRYSDQNGNLAGRTLASFTSFNTDGFTVTVSDADDGILVIYEAFK